MSELDDIRKMIDPRELDFVRGHSRSLRTNQVLDITSRRYGGGDGNFMIKVLQFSAAAIITCGVVFAGMSFINRKKDK